MKGLWKQGYMKIKRFYYFSHKGRLIYVSTKLIYRGCANKNILHQTFVQYLSNSSPYPYIWCQLILPTWKNPSKDVQILFHAFFILHNSGVEIIHRHFGIALLLDGTSEHRCFSFISDDRREIHSIQRMYVSKYWSNVIDV